MIFSALTLLSILFPLASAQGDAVESFEMFAPGYCFEDVSTISELEVGCVFPARLGMEVNSDCPDSDWPTISQKKRIYTVCPNSTKEYDSNSVTGSFPLGTINPNMEVRCGESGDSSNNCVLSGGALQFYTPHPANLEISVPQLKAKDLMPYYDVSNLIVRGFTFQGVVDDEVNNLVGTAIALFLPGQNILFSDNIIKENDGELVLVAISVVDEMYDSTGTTPYQSITFDNMLFDSNKADFIIATSWEIFEGFEYKQVYERSANKVLITNSYFANNKLNKRIIATTRNWDSFELENVCMVDNELPRDNPYIISTFENEKNLVSVTDLFLEGNRYNEDCPLLENYCTCNDLPTVDTCNVTKQHAGRKLFQKSSSSKSSKSSKKSKATKGKKCDITFKSSKSSKSSKNS